MAREGFNNVFPLETLSIFYEEELETLLCGTCEHWDVDMLADIIKFDHGCAADPICNARGPQHWLPSRVLHAKGCTCVSPITTEIKKFVRSTSD